MVATLDRRWLPLVKKSAHSYFECEGINALLRYALTPATKNLAPKSRTCFKTCSVSKHVLGKAASRNFKFADVFDLENSTSSINRL